MVLIIGGFVIVALSCNFQNKLSIHHVKIIDEV